MEAIRLLSPAEVASRLGLHPNTIYRWVKCGRIQAKRLPDGQIRIEPEELGKLLSTIKR